jgi:4-alpha-glucanotransferase
MIRSAWQSVANYSLAPMQDFLGYGVQARFNVPGTTDGNWKWRMRSDALTPGLAKNIRRLNLIYGRLSADEKQAYTNWLNSRLGDSVKPH